MKIRHIVSIVVLVLALILMGQDFMNQGLRRAIQTGIHALALLGLVQVGDLTYAIYRLFQGGGSEG